MHGSGCLFSFTARSCYLLGEFGAVILGGAHTRVQVFDRRVVHMLPLEKAFHLGVARQQHGGHVLRLPRVHGQAFDAGDVDAQRAVAACAAEAHQRAVRHRGPVRRVRGAVEAHAEKDEGQRCREMV
jgi:hypothetical protein